MSPIKTTGKYDTREQWESEVLRLRSRGVKTGMLANITQSTRSSIDSFIKRQERNY